MNPVLLRTSLSDSVYFSFISFIIIWLANFLYETLQKTMGRLHLGVVILIVLTLIATMFVLAIVNIIIKEPEKGRINLWERLVGILLFILVSAVIIGSLIFLFWFEI